MAFEYRFKIKDLGRNPTPEKALRKREIMELYLGMNKSIGIDGHLAASISPQIARALYGDLLNKFSLTFILDNVKFRDCNDEIAATLRQSLNYVAIEKGLIKRPKNEITKVNIKT
jgi:hypothetical protein